MQKILGNPHKIRSDDFRKTAEYKKNRENKLYFCTVAMKNPKMN